MGYEPTYVSVMSHDQGCVMFMHGNTCHKVPAMIHSPPQKNTSYLGFASVGTNVMLLALNNLKWS